MPATASGLRYPLGSDTNNVPLHMQNLATDIDSFFVLKSGSTMSGTLTVPYVLLSGGQAGQVNAVTRKDYVDTFMPLAGGTMSGSLVAPYVFLNSAQHGAGTAAVRLDYLQANYLNNAGGAIGGFTQINRTTSGPTLRICNSYDQIPHLDFGHSSTGSQFGYISATASNLTLGSDGEIILRPSNVDIGRIASNVILFGKTSSGVGTNGVELEYDGRIDSTVSGGSVNLYLRHNTDSDGLAYIQFANSGGGLLSHIAQDNSAPNGVYFNNATVSAPSDYRMKNDLGPVIDALSKVKSLIPRHLSWKDNEDLEFEGFFAHEVAEVAPYAVRGDKDAVYSAEEAAAGGVEEGAMKPQQLTIGAIIPLMVAAIQELEARVAALEGV